MQSCLGGISNDSHEKSMSAKDIFTHSLAASRWVTLCTRAQLSLRTALEMVDGTTYMYSNSWGIGTVSWSRWIGALVMWPFGWNAFGVRETSSIAPSFCIESRQSSCLSKATWAGESLAAVRSELAAKRLKNSQAISGHTPLIRPCPYHCSIWADKCVAPEFMAR